MSSEKTMQLIVISPEKIILDAENLIHVRIPLVGETSIGVKPGHHPLIAETAKGTVAFSDHEKTTSIELHAGVLDIENNQLTILTAGRVLDAPEEITDNTEKHFERLMATLINKHNQENQA